MSAWRAARATDVLLGEVNAAFPTRDKSSDGIIGDAAHAATVSQHNPDPTLGRPPVVRAVDVDSSIRKGLVVDDIVGHAVLACLLRNARAGHPALTMGAYVIFQRVIYSATYGWRARAYYGASPHLEHVHVTWSLAGFDSTEPFGLGKVLTEPISRPRFLLPRGGSGLAAGQVYGPDAGNRRSWIDGHESGPAADAVEAIGNSLGVHGKRLYDVELQHAVAAKARAFNASGSNVRDDGAVDAAFWGALTRYVHHLQKKAA